MAIFNNPEIRFDKDDFILSITIEDATSLAGYKAEFKVYVQNEDNTLGDVKLIKTTAGDFTPDTGGITFSDNKVLVAFDTGDFAAGSLAHNTPYQGRLVLWDTDGKRAVSARGALEWRIHPATETEV